MNAEELADAIVEKTTEGKPVTQGMLLAEYGDELRGDRAVALNNIGAVIFVGCSEMFARATLALIQERPKRVLLDPIDMVKAAASGTLFPDDLPFAVEIPEGGFEEHHFFPVAFIPVEEE